jgi:hypothetical protein
MKKSVALFLMVLLFGANSAGAYNNQYGLSNGKSSADQLKPDLSGFANREQSYSEYREGYNAGYKKRTKEYETETINNNKYDGNYIRNINNGRYQGY